MQFTGAINPVLVLYLLTFTEPKKIIMRSFLKIAGLFFVAGFLFTSCASKLPFTQDARKKYNMSDAILKKVQFYNSRDIILYRANSEAGLAIENGEVVVSSSNNEDQVIIKAGTQGAFVQSLGSDKISVRFELGDGKYLLFGGEGNYKGRYTLLYKAEGNGKGSVTYHSEKYLIKPESASAYLEFKLKKLNSYKRESRVATGVKVD